MAKCICMIQGESNAIAIGGVLRISQTSEDAPVVIEGDLRGLTPGKHGISVNTFGDRSSGSESCGPIFNPFGKSHGGLDDPERMAGDLGNIVADEDGKSSVKIEDKKGMKLIGPHSVIGRSIVIYANEDDCGRGGHELSMTTGNSGARIASGIIGISK